MTGGSGFLLYISLLLAGPESGLVLFCRDKGAIPSTRICPVCFTRMTWKECSASKYTDQFMWRCGACRKVMSIRDNSFMSEKSISFGSFVSFVWAWANKNNSMTNIAELTGLHLNTITTLRRKLNNAIAEFLLLDPMVLGGEGVVVEIDESKFGKRKYHRGSRRDGQWVLGMVERGTGRCFLIPCPGNKRDRATLLPLIMAYVRPGSVIMTDGWPAYRCLPNWGYYHFPCNHSVGEYRNPITGAHINTQEGLWTHVKKSVRGRSYISDALIEYMWRRRVNGTSGVNQIKTTFEAVFSSLKAVYGN